MTLDRRWFTLLVAVTIVVCVAVAAMSRMRALDTGSDWPVASGDQAAGDQAPDSTAPAVLKPIEHNHVHGPPIG